MKPACRWFCPGPRIYRARYTLWGHWNRALPAGLRLRRATLPMRNSIAEQLCEIALADDLIKTVHEITAGSARGIVIALSRLESLAHRRGKKRLRLADIPERFSFTYSTRNRRHAIATDTTRRRQLQTSRARIEGGDLMPKRALAGVPSEGRDKMWRAMRMQPAFQSPGADWALRRAAQGGREISAPAGSGRLSARRGRRPSRRYMLIRDTGPVPPRAGRSGVFDVNEAIARDRARYVELVKEVRQIEERLIAYGAYVEKFQPHPWSALMEMARSFKSSAATEMTLRARTKAEIAGMRFGGCADAIGVMPTPLRDYLADKPPNNVEGIEMRLSSGSTSETVGTTPSRRLSTRANVGACEPPWPARLRGCSKSSADSRATALRQRNAASIF